MRNFLKIWFLPLALTFVFIMDTRLGVSNLKSQVQSSVFLPIGTYTPGVNYGYATQNVVAVLPIAITTGGNSFGSNITIGTGDNFPVVMKVHNLETARFNSSVASFKTPISTSDYGGVSIPGNGYFYNNGSYPVIGNTDAGGFSVFESDNGTSIGLGVTGNTQVDITGSLTTTDKIIKYNNISTVGNGVPAEFATVDLTTQSAAIAATTIYTPVTTGLYRVAVYLQLTRAATTSSILGGATGLVISYTDGDGSVALSNTMPLNSITGTIVTVAAGNTTATNLNGVSIIYAKTGIPIKYAIGYTSVGGTTMQYALHIKVEAL